MARIIHRKRHRSIYCETIESTLAALTRHGQGHLPIPWKCCKVVFVLQMSSKDSVHEVFTWEFTSKTISRWFYHRILLTFWKRKIIGLCEYVRVSQMRNVTRAIMPNLSVAIWRTVLNIKLLCFPRCVPELLLSHLPKFIEFYLCIHLLNFTYAFKCYHQKCKLASL